MKEVNLYYDHYKDSFSLQKEYLSERNKLTAWLIILLVIVSGFIYDPTTLNEKVNRYVESKVNGLAFELKYLNTGVIFILLWVITRYYQVVLQIEKMYNYINECEDNLSRGEQNSSDNYVITRESSYYLESYPWLKTVVDFSYVVLMPVAIISIATIKIIKEIPWTTHFKIVDFIGLGLIILFSLLYLSNRKLKEEYFKKENYPDLNFITRLLHYLRICNKD